MEPLSARHRPLARFLLCGAVSLLVTLLFVVPAHALRLEPVVGKPGE